MPGHKAKAMVGEGKGEGLAHRIRTAIGEESARSFAMRAGISDSTLRSILKGTSPTLDSLVPIARAADVSVDWLATGEGPMYRDGLARGAAAVPSPSMAVRGVASVPALDGRLLGLCFEGIRATYRDANARIDDRSAGELAGRLYADVIAATEGDTDLKAARVALRMGLYQLRRELHATVEENQSKHLA